MQKACWFLANYRMSHSSLILVLEAVATDFQVFYVQPIAAWSGSKEENHDSQIRKGCWCCQRHGGQEFVLMCSLKKRSFGIELRCYPSHTCSYSKSPQICWVFSRSCPVFSNPLKARPLRLLESASYSSQDNLCSHACEKMPDPRRDGSSEKHRSSIHQTRRSISIPKQEHKGKRKEISSIPFPFRS